MSNGESGQPLQLYLPPGVQSFLLPKCTGGTLKDSNSDAAELVLTTESGQHIRVPVNSMVVETLHDLMGVVLNHGAIKR